MRHGVLRFFVVVRLQERHTGICFAKALRLGEAVGCVNHAFGGGAVSGKLLVASRSFASPFHEVLRCSSLCMVCARTFCFPMADGFSSSSGEKKGESR